jgi:hypothetical protein
VVPNMYSGLSCADDELRVSTTPVSHAELSLSSRISTVRTRRVPECRNLAAANATTSRVRILGRRTCGSGHPETGIAEIIGALFFRAQTTRSRRLDRVPRSDQFPSSRKSRESEAVDGVSGGHQPQMPWNYRQTSAGTGMAAGRHSVWLSG